MVKRVAALLVLAGDARFADAGNARDTGVLQQEVNMSIMSHVSMPPALLAAGEGVIGVVEAVVAMLADGQVVDGREANVVAKCQGELIVSERGATVEASRCQPGSGRGLGDFVE
jgi:hypothetical protein